MCGHPGAGGWPAEHPREAFGSRVFWAGFRPWGSRLEQTVPEQGWGGGWGVEGVGRMWRQGCEVALRTLGAARQKARPQARGLSSRPGGPRGAMPGAQKPPKLPGWSPQGQPQLLTGFGSQGNCVPFY